MKPNNIMVLTLIALIALVIFIPSVNAVSVSSDSEGYVQVTGMTSIQYYLSQLFQPLQITLSSRNYQAGEYISGNMGSAFSQKACTSQGTGAVTKTTYKIYTVRSDGQLGSVSQTKSSTVDPSINCMSFLGIDQKFSFKLNSDLSAGKYRIVGFVYSGSVDITIEPLANTYDFTITQVEEPFECETSCTAWGDCRNGIDGWYQSRACTRLINGNCVTNSELQRCTPLDPVTTCPNTICEAGETIISCPDDCGASKCPNNVCEANENYGTCPADCHFYCGDNICQQEYEWEGRSHPCPADCEPINSSICNNNGICEETESVANCPADCYVPPKTCNNNSICDVNENMLICPFDCGSCNNNKICEVKLGEKADNCYDCINLQTCNQNGICETTRGETAENCPECVPKICNNNNICEPLLGENEINCSNDCKVPPPPEQNNYILLILLGIMIFGGLLLWQKKKR